MRFDRLLGEHGLIEDTIESRREFGRIMNQSRAAPAAAKFALRAWKIGAEDFHDWLATKLGRRGRKGEQARERSETDGALAERLLGKRCTASGGMTLISPLNERVTRSKWKLLGNFGLILP